MSASWSSLHSQLLRSSTTYSFRAAFRTLNRRSPALAPFADPPALLAALQGHALTSEEKNVLLRALVDAASGDGGVADMACTTLLLALWPALDAVRGRLGRFYRDAPHALNSEVMARAVEEIRCLDLASVKWIASTIQRNVERDIRRALERGQRRARITDSDADPDAVLPCPVALPPPLPADEVLAARQLDALLGADADLVAAVVVEGLTRREAAERLGISHAAARKRYERALKRAKGAP